MNQLRWYIRLMITVGERDPSKIAKSALGMTRQYEQIVPRFGKSSANRGQNVRSWLYRASRLRPFQGSRAHDFIEVRVRL